MDLGASEARRKSEPSFLERKFRSLNLRRNASDTAVEIIGNKGLVPLYEPADCHVDFIFVHGLGGGSRKTWSASPNPAHYWPKEWLPADPDFRHVRIHSFGYNSDWLQRQQNLLTIHDWGQDLIEQIRNKSNIRHATSPVVFIGHSMGGLVIKKACILARETSRYENLAERIHGVYFLATPHRGSRLAQVLSNLLKLTPFGDKPFVGALEQGSETIIQLNAEFCHCNSIAIHSFIESIPTNLGFGSSFIVDKLSATLGYDHERIQTLNADHRSICKFDSPNDSNFRTLRDSLASTVDDIEHTVPMVRQQVQHQEMQTVSAFLAVSDSPIDELSNLNDARMPGSCEWFTSGKTFLDWQYSEDSTRYFWLTGQPGVGKSVITAHAIGCLGDITCSYYFFNHEGENKPSLGGMLLSLAYQMAKKSSIIREMILGLSKDVLGKHDYRRVWRKLFMGGIFLTKFTTTHYWVIDSLDQCVATKEDLDNFFSLLANINSCIPIKIFISSRFSDDYERLFRRLPYVTIQISAEDSLHDIRMYVEARVKELTVENEEMKINLVETMVRKSAGCFLWTVLVMEELLLDGFTSQDIEEILDEVPEKMDLLYRRNLEIMTNKTRSRKLARSILVWTLCATRALTIDELKDAIRLDTGAIVTRDLERNLPTICCHFVVVDKQKRVQIVHETARAFLLNPKLESDFRIQIPLDNVQLGLACLRSLTSDRTTITAKCKGSTDHALFEYACLSFSEHLARSTSSSDALFLALMEFLKGSVLIWIETMAKRKFLDSLMKTATHLKAYQLRRAKYAAPLRDSVSSWAVDLPRIVTEFGTNLTNHPSAIYNLIPPLCPKSSGLYRQFGSLETGLRLRGLSNSDWNDRISCWHYNKTARSIACQDQWFAIGLSDGLIHMYWTLTCQDFIRLNHGEAVRILCFGNLGKTLISTGLRIIKLWDVSNGSLLWEYRLESDPMAVNFNDDDRRVVAATRSKQLFTWSTENGNLISQHTWHRNLPLEFQHITSKAPSSVAISPNQKLMAIVYRSLPLCLWDLDTQQHLGFCTKTPDDGSDTSNNINSICFTSDPGLNLIAVAYWDGDIAIFETTSRTMRCHAKIQTQVLAVSPDGKTLAGGDSNGNVQLFDFETLQLMYRVSLSDGVGALAFTGDNLRVMDLRGTEVNVWEPDVLVRKWDYADEDRSEFSSDVSERTMQDAGIPFDDQNENITVIQTVYEGTMVICGRASGSIAICDITSSETTFQELCKPKGIMMAILSLDWNETHQLAASADASSAFKVVRLFKDCQHTIDVRDEILNAQLPYGHLITQLLISPDGIRLLVSSSTADFIWSLETGSVVSSREIEHRTEWRWLTHPRDITKILLLEDSTLQSFRWDASSILSPEVQTPISMGNHRFVDLKSMVVQKNDCKLIVKLGLNVEGKPPAALNGTNDTVLYTLDLSQTELPPPSLHPEPLFPSQAVNHTPKVKLLLGTAPGPLGSPLLLFISETGWIYSINLRNSSPHSTFQRHFFIPFAWLSTSASIITGCTVRKDILFVRGHEVAIIGGGLKAAETISISESNYTNSYLLNESSSKVFETAKIG
ncbi:hypothetical protein EG329_002339 [Mollisiaceae sp. DMI_Dod_QoI]|nr:hypothetical protein EG329_002339 [Helotiales sp. DMI_Dod_QoI]